MTARPRLIPTLLLEDGRLVKTRGFRNPAYVGDPVNAVRIFNDKGADELMVLDIGRRASRRGPDMPVLRRIATECFMPLSYGGGVTTAAQASQLVSIGVEKVCTTTAWVAHPDLLTAMGDAVGRQSVVAGLDVRRRRGAYEAVVHGGRRWTGRSPVDLARQAVQAGAGELLVQDVDRDGTLQGLNLDLVRLVAHAVQVPIIACGGARDAADVAAAVRAGASAVAAGALVVFKGPHRAVLLSLPQVPEVPS